MVRSVDMTGTKGAYLDVSLLTAPTKSPAEAGLSFLDANRPNLPLSGIAGKRVLGLHKNPGYAQPALLAHFVGNVPRREAHRLKEGRAPRYSGTIAAGENVRAIDEKDHAFRKLPGAKFVHSSRGVQIALPGENARRGEAVSALLKELNAILDFHVPLTPPYPTQACKRRVAAELRRPAQRDTPAS
jgi:hypothetical protein